VGTDLVKIGLTRNTVAQRLAHLQGGHPHQVEIVASLYVSHRLYRCEKAVHAFLAPYHHRGEWFTLEITPDSFTALVMAALEAARGRDGSEVWADVILLSDAPPAPPYEPPSFDGDIDLFPDLPIFDAPIPPYETPYTRSSMALQTP
jgi:hypothetical protein